VDTFREEASEALDIRTRFGLFREDWNACPQREIDPAPKTCLTSTLEDGRVERVKIYAIISPAILLPQVHFFFLHFSFLQFSFL
jgi:hypothetical protein